MSGWVWGRVTLGEMFQIIRCTVAAGLKSIGSLAFPLPHLFHCNKFVCKVNLSSFNDANIEDLVSIHFELNDLKIMISHVIHD